MYKILANTEFIGKMVHYLPTCHSTNAIAADLVAKGGTSDGTIVITDNQTRGLGQVGNSWESEEAKNLTFTIILYPSDFPANSHFDLTKITALGITDYLTKFLNIGSRIKWPNDILYGNTKLGGILINNSIRNNKIIDTIVGIGLNINQTEFKNPNAISLTNITGREYKLQSVLEGVAVAIENRIHIFRSSKRNSIDTEYLLRLYGINEERQFYVPKLDQKITGLIRGVDNSGLLKIEVEGKLSKYGFKDIVFI